MNIIQIQDRLKGMPKEAIIQYVQNPTGEVPTYLALGELERRKTMENKYSAMKPEASTVAEQIVQENMPMGLGSITPSEAMSPSMAMSPEAGIVSGMDQTPSSVAQPSSVMAAGSGIANLPVPQPSFAGGGIVAFKKGGAADLTLNPNDLTVLNKPAYDYNYDYENYYDFPRAALVEVPKPLSIEERMKQQREAYTSAGVDPDFYKKQADELMAEREALKADKSEAANMALLKAGLGIMGGTSYNPSKNISEGAMPAIESYGSDIKDIKAQERLMKQAGMKMAEAEQAMARGDVNAAMKAMEERDDKIIDIKTKNAELETSMLIAGARAEAEKTGKNADIISKAVSAAKEQLQSFYSSGYLDFVPTPEEEAQGITAEIKVELKFQELLRNNLAVHDLDTSIADKYKVGKSTSIGTSSYNPKVTTKEDYDKVPSGAKYIDVNGNVRVKK
jgi:hypothetical protein